MLSRILGCVCVVCGIAVPPVWAEVIDAPSVITEAVVYPSSARVTRAVKVPLKPGEQTVRFSGVQPVFDENSLSVRGQGTAAVKILGAGIRTVFLTQSSDQRVRELEDKIQAVDDALAAMGNDLATLDARKAFLDSVRLFNGQQLPKDLVSKVPSAAELTATLTFLEEGVRSYGSTRLALGIAEREKQKERQALVQELDQLRSGQGRQERVLAVDLECSAPGDLTLEISYTVARVGWYPLYDARVEFDKGKAVLSSFAVVRQTTGEDWTDVRLTLSTARPSVGGRMPELDPWYLRSYVMHSPRKTGLMKMAMETRMRQAADDIAAPSMVAAEGFAAGQANAEVAYASGESSGVSLAYHAARPVTIKSDGSEVRVPLTVQTLDAAFEYAATPKLSTYAYLKSRVTNDPQEPLLAGRVNIFLDGTYVGASDIAATVAPGEAFDLYLGVDEGVTVKRQLVAQKSDDTLIGGIPSPTRKITFTYKITVENFKPRAVTLKLFDQVPVSQDDKIKVVKVQPSLKPDTEKYEDREGVYLWTLALASREKKEITLVYVVEYPRDMRVDGL